MKNLMRFAAYTLVLAATMAGVYIVTRSGQPAASRQHSAIQTSEVAQPVMLSAADARRIGVTYATATVGPLDKEIRTVGQIVFDETRLQTIAPKIDGYVDELFVNATGQRVQAGQPLLTIYSPMLVTAQEELLLAKRLNGDVANAGPDARSRAADLLASARQRLAYWDISDSAIAEIERTGQVKKTLTLRAPSNGYVLEKNVLAGQKVTAGDALYKEADLSTVWVEGDVFEQDLASVQLGQRVEVDLDALPGQHRTGSITYVYPTLNPDTRTAKVRVVLTNPGLALKPGMYATIHVSGETRGRVLTVPRSAVLSTGERSIVFVRDARGMLQPQEVVLGASNDDRVEILQGLSAGQTVVASATFLVDAESNLGTALGGMGNMPGMDMTTPPKPATKK